MSGIVSIRRGGNSLMLCVLVFATSVLCAATVTVDLSGAGDFTDLQTAIESAATGDTIIVKPGEYVVTVPLTFRGKAIRVKAEAGRADTAIRLSNPPESILFKTVVSFDSAETDASILEGFTLSGGIDGGVLCFRSSPTLADCDIAKNAAPRGAGICCYYGSPTLTDCVIRENSAADLGGGIFCSVSAPRITRCTISANWAPNGGAVGLRDSTAVLTDCAITGNSATEWFGGGIYSDGSSVSLTNCTLVGNSAYEGGAVLLSHDPESFLSVTNSIVWENAGGSIRSEYGDVLPTKVAISYSCIEGNERWSGEGNIETDPLFCGWGDLAEVYVDGTNPRPGDGSQTNPYSTLLRALEYDVRLSRRSPCLRTGRGGADMGAAVGACEVPGRTSRLVHVAPGSYRIGGPSLVHHASIQGAGEGKTSIRGTVFGLRTGARLSNVAVTEGSRAGVYISDGEAPEVSSCTIFGNGFGGGILCDRSSATVNACTISGNRGSGIASRETSLTVSNCTITENGSWSYRGGGIGAFRGSLTVACCTITDNSTSSGGGGIHCTDCSLSITDCTISRNAAGVGGVLLEQSDAIARRCMISENRGGGVGCVGGVDPPVTIAFADCMIVENLGDEGAIVSSACSPEFVNCVIMGNIGKFAGGMQCSHGSPVLTNCTMAGNIGTVLYCAFSASPILTNCTIAWNSGMAYAGGIFCRGRSRPVLVNTILWSNGPMPIALFGDSDAEVTYSCLETSTPWPGEGNISGDPQFCGFGRVREVYVDGTASAPGDGTQAHPYPGLRPALGYSLALSRSSPCLGSGRSGTNMGADWGICEVPGEGTRAIHLGPGNYTIPPSGLAYPFCIRGAGQEKTAIGGTIYGLRTGAELSHVRVAEGVQGGILIPPGESPRILNCAIVGNSGNGISCYENSSPVIADCEIADNAESGVECLEGSSPVISGCRISRNWSQGIWCKGYSSPWCQGSVSLTVTECNVSLNGGDGLLCGPGSSASLTNCSFAGNCGNGVCFEGDLSLRMTKCTLVGNASFGVLSGGSPSIVMNSCIVWHNVCGSIMVSGAFLPDVNYSCIDGKLWRGKGNIDEDPLLCGWGAARGVYVEAASPAPGEGTRANPFREIASALNFDVALAKDSPCLGTGEGSANMGADVGICDMPGERTRLIHVGPGRYRAHRLNLSLDVSIEGGGSDKTVIEGAILGLRTGAVLSRVMVTGSDMAAVSIGRGQAPVIEDCAVQGNEDVAIYSFGGATPAIRGCEVTGNRAYGGAFFCYQSSPTIANCTISGNSGELGALRCEEASPTITNCTISNNYGGGLLICARSRPTIVNCRILGNVARVGGGVYCAGGSSAEFVNCAIAGNMAYRGGGIYCKYSAPRFVNCTVSRNTAVVRDGGISCVEATPTLINCILWRNAFESLCGTRLSCIADRDPLFVNPGVFDFTRYVSAEICGEWFEIPDYVVEDPDHHLKAGSPAIDSGTCEGAPDFDIEGSPRPTGLGCDIGAYEFAGVGEPLFVRGEANADGKLDIADMIYILSYEFTLGSRPLCLKAADITDDGIIDIGDPIAGLNYLFASGRVPPPPLSDCGVDPTADALTCDSYPACP